MNSNIGSTVSNIILTTPQHKFMPENIVFTDHVVDNITDNGDLTVPTDR